MESIQGQKSKVVHRTAFMCVALLMSLAALAGGEKRPVSIPEPAAPKPTPSVAVEKPATETEAEQLAKWCAELKPALDKYAWGPLYPCGQIELKIAGKSVEGRPLVYAEFGSKDAPNKTLIFSMVHPDELIPLYIVLKLMKWLHTEWNGFGNTRVVIAPLVNPDRFFSKVKTRVNARGVDLNRNFATADWEKDALKKWKNKFRSDPRRFPGNSAGSEPETIFQSDLITALAPQKIISIHAPLNFIDYDGPNVLKLAQFPKEYINKCLQLKKRVRATPGGFFPGSLGNYAGQELGIPTFTLELPSANPRRARSYWNQFRSGIGTVIKFEVPNYVSISDQTKGG